LVKNWVWAIFSQNHLVALLVVYSTIALKMLATKYVHSDDFRASTYSIEIAVDTVQRFLRFILPSARFESFVVKLSKLSDHFFGTFLRRQSLHVGLLLVTN
jgi:hypothetical protein